MTAPSSEQAPVGAILGRFVAAFDWADIPAAVQHQGRRSLLNFFATAIGSARDPDIDSAVAVLASAGGAGEATLIGRTGRMDILSAAFVNAVSANLYDFDDTHLRTVIHPTAPVAPPALALAEQRGLSGQATLLAFLLGAEIECRLGNAVSPHHYARGWHITATCGVFGAAAAAARVLGLDPARIAHALGIAASQSSGIVENLPNAAKNVGVGNAARNGLFAALLAAQGYTGAAQAIEGPRGWARAMGDEPDIAELVGGLGERWEVGLNTFKPYPCGIVVHAVIDACLELRAMPGISAATIAQVTVSGDALLLARADRIAANERDAKISLQHAAAVAFLFGAAGLAEFSAETVARQDVAAFRSRVRTALDATIPRGAARVTVETQAGQTVSVDVTHARGSLAQPMSDADLEAKVRALLDGTGCDAARVIEAVWTLDRSADVTTLLRAARPR